MKIIYIYNSSIEVNNEADAKEEEVKYIEEKRVIIGVCVCVCVCISGVRLVCTPD